eukprot:NODE_4705_length_1127_cov_52.144422_g4172_i0.p1 GENE.NODE_4705_length_1127_cov_52.144422_g4172_i0~~NODE_4705_length_1127_cov_52.144422_g4172_i0.p1  ORF type:complete len:333 (-),score=75.69 NODE_4705_length_1127_cov_52.144422_g4172_i0:69-1067(-)
MKNANMATPLPLFGNAPYTLEESEKPRTALSEPMPDHLISERPGPNGDMVNYVESWRTIELANDILSYNGWSSNIVEITHDYCDELATGRYSAGCSAIVRVTLRDGAFHEDIGYGTSENNKSKGSALEHAKKKAVSDATKRALRYFGHALGLTVYDKKKLKKNLEKRTTPYKRPSGTFTPRRIHLGPTSPDTTDKITSETPSPPPSSNLSTPPPSSLISNSPSTTPNTNNSNTSSPISPLPWRSSTLSPPTLQNHIPTTPPPVSPITTLPTSEPVAPTNNNPSWSPAPITPTANPIYSVSRNHNYRNLPKSSPSNSKRTINEVPINKNPTSK